MGNNRSGRVCSPGQDLEYKTVLKQLKNINTPGAGTPQPGQAISRRNTGQGSEQES